MFEHSLGTGVSLPLVGTDEDAESVHSLNLRSDVTGDKLAMHPPIAVACSAIERMNASIVG
jgi:hypothetical protein